MGGEGLVVNRWRAREQVMAYIPRHLDLMFWACTPQSVSEKLVL